MSGDHKELAVLLQGHPSVAFVLGPHETAVIVGCLQLAMRHPEERQLKSSRVVFAVIDHLIEALSRGNPRIAEIMSSGNQPPAEWN